MVTVDDGGDPMKEPTIIINGCTLSDAESRALRITVSSCVMAYKAPVIELLSDDVVQRGLDQDHRRALLTIQETMLTR